MSPFMGKWGGEVYGAHHNRDRWVHPCCGSWIIVLALLRQLFSYSPASGAILKVPSDLWVGSCLVPAPLPQPTCL